MYVHVHLNSSPRGITDPPRSTVLLAYRIWSIDREVRNILPARTTSLMPVVRIILESGLINVAYLFAFVLVVEFGSQAFELMCDMVSRCGRSHTRLSF